ncbi:glycine--tRNA ligase subunit alpha [candidate division WOR-3 bacterium]|nr:glycine--tRNA ligase subunit alpha [candidate division WOR-3 bacterium]
MDFQTVYLKLEKFWADKGCLIGFPYTTEVGAGTFNPLTFFGALGKEPLKVAYIETSKRPKDGRYAKNPNRMQQFRQYQVLLKPPPEDIQDLFLESLKALSIDLKNHDIRFVEDDWESPTLGAWGSGWEVWLDGQEITQFTYFQQMGGIELYPVSVELTYGLERIAIFLSGSDSVFDLPWSKDISWGELNKEQEYQFCVYNFDEADINSLFGYFDECLREAERLIDKELLYPGYDFVVKASHTFNLLDARGALSVKKRNNYILEIRKLARKAAIKWQEL